MSSELSHGFRLGPWKVEPLRGAVTGPNGVAHHLEPKVMDVFVCLARQANEVVTREELQEAVWSDRAVTDESLTRAIRELRHALEDVGRDSEYIETVPKRGYRLIGQIRLREGSKLEKDLNSSVYFTNFNKAKLSFVIAIALAAALTYFAYDEFVVGRMQEEAPAITSTQDAEIGDTGRQKKSLAVLPFENMSSDIGNEHFGDGLAEEIRSLLANNPNLRVIGRSSSSAFKGSKLDLRDIGKQLGVSTLLEGSVRRSGETLRITVQLVDASDASSIWAHTYERPMTEIFALQDEIAASVISQVEGNMALQPPRRLPTDNIEAYALYVEAQGLLGNFSISNVKAAEERLLRAVELDPDFAAAYEQLAFTYWEQSGVAIGMSEGQLLQRQAATEAVRLDPERAAFARFLWSDSIASTPLSQLLDDLRTLARTGQRKPFVLGTLTWYLIYTGYFREALVFAQHFLEHDPYSANSHRQVYYALLANGRQREAIEALEIAARLGGGPNSLLLAQSQYVLRRDEESIAAFKDAWRDNGVDADWLPDLLAGAARADSGQEYLDRSVPEILATLPEEQLVLAQKHLLLLYLQFSYLDRYYKLIEELGIGQFGDHIEFTWMGTMMRDSGFTAHPGYQRVAEAVNFHELWDTRGPPDMCEKRNDVWVCE